MKNKLIIVIATLFYFFLTPNETKAQDCCAGFYVTGGAAYCIANLNPCDAGTCNQAALEAAHGIPTGGFWVNILCTGGPADCSASCIPANTSGLPVELVHFDLGFLESGIELHWQTASEINNEGFEIEHSKDGVSWEYMDFVRGNGTTDEFNEYRFLDKNPSLGFNYYRLKQIDFDGAYEYSYVRVAIWQGSTDLDKLKMAVLPNPATTWITAALPTTITKDENIQFRIFNQVGSLVKTEVVGPESQIRIDLDGLPSGYYVLNASQKNFQYSTSFIKK